MREFFPALQNDGGKRIAYFDTAASALRPDPVIDAVSDFYRNNGANIHRGVHRLSQSATSSFEEARETVADFLGASRQEVIFTSGTTEGMNWVAHSLAEKYLNSGDEVVISELEHHSNILPWQHVCTKVGAKLRVAKIREDGSLPPESIEKEMSNRTKIVSVTEVSNALGVATDTQAISEITKKYDAIYVVDGAQGVVHQTTRMVDVGADFYLFSGHKLYAPNGIGVVWAKEPLLADLPPFRVGGGMIAKVGWDHYTMAKIPFRFEGGTPHVPGAIGLAAAIDFLQGHAWAEALAQEKELHEKAVAMLTSQPGVSVIAPEHSKFGAISFVVEGAHPSDIGSFLDAEGVYVRVGHHCTQPLMKRLQLPGTIRASLGVYSNEEDIHQLEKALAKSLKILGVGR